ncbi:MAG: ABC transporter permease, partial [Anaerolineae bacterium]
MNPLMSISMALRALMSNKLRAGLTMLGIIIGVGAVIALVGAGAGAEAQVTERFRSLGSNLLVISPGARAVRGVSQGRATTQSLTNDDVEAIARLASVVSVIAPEYSAGNRQVVYGSK